MKRLAARFDAYSLRERVMLFAGLAVVLVFIADRTLIEPQLAQSKILASRIADQATQLGSLEVQIKALQQAQANDPDAVNRGRVERAQQQLSQLESEFAASQKGLVRAENMAALLGSVLKEHRGLQLVDLRTLPPLQLLERAADKAADAGTPAAAGPAPTAVAAAPAGAERNLYKHGFELTVRGSYPDFVQYLSHLEQLPTHMYWGKATMNADDYPQVTLTLTIYTLSLDKAWLVV